MLKNLLIVIVASLGVLTALSFAPVNYEPVSRTEASNGDGCPDGSYNIGIEKNGEVICKLEPTGCPYGDSIPLDSPKCVPSPEELTKQKENEVKNVGNNTSGVSDTRSTESKEEYPTIGNCGK